MSRAPLTTTLVMGLFVGGLVGYGWGLLDGAHVHILVPCGHEGCAGKQRSPIFPFTGKLGQSKTDHILVVPIEPAPELSPRPAPRHQQVGPPNSLHDAKMITI
jgi:hypothetical protein